MHLKNDLMRQSFHFCDPISNDFLIGIFLKLYNYFRYLPSPLGILGEDRFL